MLSSNCVLAILHVSDFGFDKEHVLIQTKLIQFGFNHCFHKKHFVALFLKVSNKMIIMSVIINFHLYLLVL